MVYIAALAVYSGLRRLSLGEPTRKCSVCWSYSSGGVTFLRFISSHILVQYICLVIWSFESPCLFCLISQNIFIFENFYLFTPQFSRWRWRPWWHLVSGEFACLKVIRWSNFIIIVCQVIGRSEERERDGGTAGWRAIRTHNRCLLSYGVWLVAPYCNLTSETTAHDHKRNNNARVCNNGENYQNATREMLSEHLLLEKRCLWICSNRAAASFQFVKKRKGSTCEVQRGELRQSTTRPCAMDLKLKAGSQRTKSCFKNKKVREALHLGKKEASTLYM